MAEYSENEIRRLLVQVARDQATVPNLKYAAFLDELYNILLDYLDEYKDLTPEKQKRKRDRIILFILRGFMALGLAYASAVALANAIVYQIDTDIGVMGGLAAIRQGMADVASDLLALDMTGSPRENVSKVKQISSFLFSRVMSAAGVAGVAVGNVKTHENIRKVEKAAAMVMEGKFAEAGAKFGIRYVYAHSEDYTNSCVMCLSNIGKICDGTGHDGVPVPPLHPNCRCFLMPAPEGKAASVANIDPLYTMRKLKWSDKQKVLGPTRVTALKRGDVTLDDLFTPDYTRLKTLDELRDEGIDI